MKYCKKCLIPDTKPYMVFDENGVCSACISHDQKRKKMGGIDWKSREKEFAKLVLEAKAKNAPFYDVLVPVSGGKDSITQVHRLLKYDLRILAVNVDYGIKTEVGHYNLSLIPKMGASLITYRPSLPFHQKLIRIGFEDFGDPDLLSHTLLHAYPLHVALQFKIPLVLHGENSAFEYGGEDALAQNNTITRAWFTKYAANSGHDARYISKHYGIPMEKLRLYDFPDELEKSDTSAVFMGYYFYWDSEEHLKIAKKYGFKTLDKPSEGTYRNYVGIDEKINRLHQHIKVLKFGYGRATDHACEDIRNGRLTREEAKKLVQKHDLLDISDYYVNDFIEFIGISRENFLETLDKYRNREIWKQDADGRWYIPGHLGN
jgi:N-acetyl sugar amidotransferase